MHRQGVYTSLFLRIYQPPAAEGDGNTAAERWFLPISVNYRGHGQSSQAFWAGSTKTGRTPTRYGPGKKENINVWKKNKKKKRQQQRQRWWDWRDVQPEETAAGWDGTGLTWPFLPVAPLMGSLRSPPWPPIVDNDLRLAVRLQRGIDRSAGHCQQSVNRPKRPPCYLQVTYWLPWTEEEEEEEEHHCAHLRKSNRQVYLKCCYNTC